jgi:hypothetical protein
MRRASPTRALVAAAILAIAVVAPGCGRPPDEAWLRFLGFRDDGNSTLTVLEGDLNDGNADSANAAFSNVSVIVGGSDSGAGTGILVTRAHVDYTMSGYSPPSEEYPLNLYLGPSSHTNGTAGTTAGSTEGETSFPLATASLKQWLIDTGAFSDSSATPTVRLTADVTFFAETDEGTELEVHGSIAILLSTSGGGSGTGTPTVNISATTSTATTAAPGKFTITRSGSTTNSLTVNYEVKGTATAGSDYEELFGSVTINAGSSTATIPVTPLASYTPGKTVVVTISSGSAYTVGSSSEASVTITD